MKLSRKEFKIVQLVENREDYCLYEFLYIFGISFSYNWYGLDGYNGMIPYTRLISAKEKLKELEQLEEVEQPLRDGTISLILIVSFVILFWVIKSFV
jgi:hypothetical protein